MKVVHISTYGRHGGAGQAAWRLHQQLRQQGVQSNMLYLGTDASDPSLIPLSHPASSASGITSAYTELFINRNRTEVSNTVFSSELEGMDVHLHPAVKKADLIHLHWISGMLSAPHIARLLATGKPVIWTLHDMAPFTGGCHYSAGCLGFTDGCRSCPQLRSLADLLPAAQLQDKELLWKQGRLGFITLNDWMTGLLKASPLAAGRAIAKIPNGIDLTKFSPGNRSASRRALQIPESATVLLFAASSFAERRKGAGILTAALDLLANKRPHRRDARPLVVFAAGRDQFPETKLPVRALGWCDEAAMSGYYSAADLFVLPSLEDNLPNTVAESLACGTPVVGFATGGVPEMIQDNRTGFLVREFTAEKLAGKLEQALADKPKLATMRTNCRAQAEAHYKAETNTRTVVDFYQRMLAKTKRPAKRLAPGFPGPALSAFLNTPLRETLGISPAELLVQVSNIVDRTQLSDLRRQNQELTSLAKQHQQDAIDRFTQIEKLTALLKAAQTESAKRATQIDKLTALAKSHEGHAIDRLAQVEKLTALLKDSHSESNKRAKQITQLTAANGALRQEADARLEQIQSLTALTKQREQESLARATQIETLANELNHARAQVAARVAQLRHLTGLLQQREKDATARAEQVKSLTAVLKSAQDESARQQAQIEKLRSLVVQHESDSIARLDQINALTTLVKHHETESANRYAQIGELTALAKQLETESTARAKQIELLTGLLRAAQAESAARFGQIEKLTALVKAEEKELAERDAAERLANMDKLTAQIFTLDAENQDLRRQIAAYAQWLQEAQKDIATVTAAHREAEKTAVAALEELARLKESLKSKT